MKKLIVIATIASFLFAGTAQARTTSDLNALYTRTLQTLIDLLIQQVAQLQKQLQELQAKQEAMQQQIVPAPQVTVGSPAVVQATSTPVVIPTPPTPPAPIVQQPQTPTSSLPTPAFVATPSIPPSMQPTTTTPNTTQPSNPVVVTPKSQDAPIVIAEVQITGGVGKTDNDFVKLYNPALYAADIGGWKLRKRTKTGNESLIRVFATGTTIPREGYYILANPSGGFAASIGANESTNNLALAGDNSVALFNASGVIIDALAWGNGHTNPFVEGNPYPANPEGGQILKRKVASGVIQNTRNTAGDFEIPIPIADTNPTSLMVAANALGTGTGRSKSAMDDIGNITFSASGRSSVSLKQLTIAFGGTAPSSTMFMESVDLVDMNGNRGAGGAASSTSGACAGNDTCSKTWNFGAGIPILPGDSYVLKLRIDSTRAYFGGAGVSTTFTATIDSVISNADVPIKSLPVQINSVAYVQGS